MVDFAVDHLRLAGATQAMPAGMREIDAGAQAGVENGLAFRDFDRFAQGIDRQLMADIFSSPGLRPQLAEPL